MESVSVLFTCLLSFLVVFILLAFLAVVIRLVAALLPVSTTRTDPAVIAAIHAAVATQIPGAQVTSIEEIPK
jgi:hypothetical protein